MDNLPTIIVTGSSGLVGSGLVSYFSNLGFKIRAFQREVPDLTNPLVTYYQFDLNNVQDRGFEGADYLVHCAYRPFVSKKERNSGVSIDIEATKKIIRLSRKYNIKIIFLSTLSAHSGSKTYYAKNKLLAEKLFDLQKDLILKLGIVLGQGGGLFGRIATALKKHRIVPLIGGGRQRVQIIALDDLYRVIRAAINKNIVGTYMIAHPAIITMKQIYKGIARVAGVKPLFIFVPWTLAYLILWLAENMGLRLSFTAQNVLGLKDLRTFDTAPDLEVFELEAKDYQTTFDQLSYNR